ncbi:hypothetical protein TSOC_009687 [Tetrabaena socialis]|uniref:MYND-type domain-containing protein n=1 Tax=Tetrabaena socialis TaxID=47790 RepID=A0A2J7ZV79_9CHLO|nr:hypothetical protein TSOC_009687 [Tetrabaena socialis]|eukprot:PNH04181.1 hypothetical protein TSOC_009687 [Tetrabaena socialis]
MNAWDVQLAEQAIEKFIRFWPPADPQQPLGAPFSALSNAIGELGCPYRSNSAFDDAARPALLAALPVLARALPKAIALLSTVCSAAREPAWAAVVPRPVVLRQLLTDGPTVGAMADAARLALHISAPALLRAGDLPAHLPSAIWVSSMQRVIVAEACAAATWKLLSDVAVFAWEAVQAACSLPPHTCSLRDAVGAVDESELPVTPEQQAVAARLVRSLQASQLLATLCDVVLRAPKPAYTEGYSVVGEGVATGPEDDDLRFNMLQAATRSTLRCIYGVCQLAQDAGEAAAPGPSLLAAPEVRRMLLALLQVLIEHGEGGTQGGGGGSNGNGSRSVEGGGASGSGGSGGSGAPVAAGECAGLRYALQHLPPKGSYALHGELLRTTSVAWRRRPDLRPKAVQCHARLAARMLRAACRLHRGQGWGGVRLAECFGIDFDSGGEVGTLPVLGMIPLLTHTELVVTAAAEAPPAERLAALPDALEAAAWCLAAVAEQGSYLGPGGARPGSFCCCQEAVKSLLHRTASLLVEDPITGWAVLQPELRAQVIQRLSSAGLLRSLDALLRLLVTHAPPPEDDGQPWCALAATSQAILLRPLLLPLLRTALAPPAAGAGGGGGSSDPAWEAPRELGVLVTAAKLTTRELWRFGLGGSRGGSSRGGSRNGGGGSGSGSGGGRVADADRLVPALCYDQLLSVALEGDTGLPSLLHGHQALPRGCPARQAVVEALRLCAGASFRLGTLHLQVAARMGRYPGPTRGLASAAKARRQHIHASLQGLCTFLHALPACVDNLPPACVLALQPGLLLAELGALLHRLAPADEPDPRTEGALRRTVASGVRVALACMAAHPQLTGAARALLAPPEGEASGGGAEGGGGGGGPRLDAEALVVRLQSWAELEALALGWLRRAALLSAECLRAVAALLPRLGADDPKTPPVTEEHVTAIVQMMFRTSVGQPGPEAGASGRAGGAAVSSQQQQPGGGGAEGAGAAAAAAAARDAGSGADAGVSAPGQKCGRGALRLCANPCCTDYSGPSEAGLRLRPCAACHAVRYCSEACQRQHWRAAHKRECGQLSGV